MRLFLRLLGFVRPYWRRLLAALVCMVVFAFLSGISLGMILPFVNVLFEREELVSDAFPAQSEVQVSDDQVGRAADVGSDRPNAREGLPLAAVEDLKSELRGKLLAYFASDTLERALWKICVALLAVFFVRLLFGYLKTYLMITVEQSAIRDIRDRLFARLSELSLSFFHRERTGLLVSRITNDVTLVRRALVATFANLFGEALQALLYLGIAVWISWRLALVAFAVLPPIVLIIAKIGRRLRRRSVRIQEKMADIASTLEEAISGIRVVKAFGMEGYERERFFRHTREYFRTYVRMELLGALLGPLTEYLGVIGVVVLLWYGGRFVLTSRTVSPDWFIIFLAATLSTLQPFRKLSKANSELQVGLAAAGRIFQILDTKPAIVSRPGARVLRAFEDRIVYEGVSFRYDTGDYVLRSIDLGVRKGEVIAIVGPSGAGKSTLLDLLPRFYDPTEGRITIDGHDLRDVDVGSLRRLMGIVTQETILFNDTVWNNIAYGLQGARHEEVVAAAKAANAHDFIESMPQGYHTEIGERGVMVSGGERQRIAIARAILKNPPILIFDEATSSLDSESERLVQEAIEHLLKGRTVLVIAHRLSTVRNSDRIVVIEKGEIVETGTHRELMDLGGLYRYLYDMQFKDGAVERGQAEGRS